MKKIKERLEFSAIKIILNIKHLYKPNHFKLMVSYQVLIYYNNPFNGITVFLCPCMYKDRSERNSSYFLCWFTSEADTSGITKE